MKDCPNCNTNYTKMAGFATKHSKRVFCCGCSMEGPYKPTEAEAIVAWNALPRREDNVELLDACKAALYDNEHGWRKSTAIILRAAIAKAEGGE